MLFSVPYRDSVLTSLLKNALGGNSKTIMVLVLETETHPCKSHFNRKLVFVTDSSSQSC